MDKIITDFHMHSKLSSDAESSWDEMIDGAIAAGCQYIALTEHCNLDFIKHNYHKIGTTDLCLYDKEYKRLKEKYDGRISLTYGLEIGYDSELTKEYSDIIKKYNYDYIINSIHLIRGVDSYWQRYFKGREKDEAYGNYIIAVYESLSAPYRFNTVGHFGYVTRTSPYESRDMFHGYESLVEAVLKKMIEKGVALELNSNVKDAPGACLPQKEIVRFYKDLGGELVVFGSDAHRFTDVCRSRQQVMELLKECGFKYHCIFVGKDIKMLPV